MVSKTSSSWKLQLLLTTKYGIKDIVKLEITTLTNNNEAKRVYFLYYIEVLISTYHTILLKQNPWLKSVFNIEKKMENKWPRWSLEIGFYSYCSIKFRCINTVTNIIVYLILDYRNLVCMFCQ